MAAKVKKQKEEEIDSSNPFKSLFKVTADSYASLSKTTLPISLNKYYEPYIENVRNVLLFLERFSEENETVANLIKVYKSNKEFSTNKDTLDLDLLAEKASLSKGELRRLINNTIDILGDEEAMLLLKMNRIPLIEKSIQIALTDLHPNSYEERKALLQNFGVVAVPKSAQVLVNIDKSQNLSLNDNRIGLPSFASSISANEKIASDHIQTLLNKDDEKNPKVKQLSASPDMIPLYNDKTPLVVEQVNAEFEDLKELEKEKEEEEDQ